MLDAHTHYYNPQNIHWTRIE